MFIKQYGFYLAVGVISIGAMTAVFMTGDKQGDTPVLNESPSTIVDTDSEVDTGEKDVLEGSMSHSEDIVEGEDLLEVDEVSDVVDTKEPDTQNPDTQNPDTDVDLSEGQEEDMVSETFSSTTAEDVAPYFASGDTLLWPVQGEIIVPYKDNQTNHWMSKALNQTMRTYGVCISAQADEMIKAPAKAKVVDIVSDATKYKPTLLVGNVGEVIVLDLGNGYQVDLGIQGGKINKELLGQVVEAGQSLGTVGKGTGPFADLSYNVYLQVRKSDEVINPSTLLMYHEDVAGVDMGHDAE